MLGNFFSTIKNRLKKKEGPTRRAYSSLDIKLIKGRPLPNLRQIKYLPRFLDKKEKSIFWSAISAVALGSLVLLVFFLVRHIYAVPKDGGDYTEAMIGQPKYINPLYSSISDTDSSIAALIYTGLFQYKGLELSPDLAESYIVSSDKKTYDIKLRPNIRWSDNEPFTAEDVLYSFDLIQNPEVGSPLYNTFQGVRVEKLDEGTLRFSLKEPFAPFLSTLTVGILPQHVWGEISPASLRLAKNNLQPIGTGPWQFSKLTKDDAGNIQNYALTHNKNFYAKQPYLKTITFRFFNDIEYSSAMETAVENVKSQNVDAVAFAPRDYKDKLVSRHLNQYLVRLPQYTALFFNQAQATVLKDADVRLALAMATDKDSLINGALSGNGEKIDSPILAGNIGYFPEIKRIAFNQEDAAKLLDKNWNRIQPEDFYQQTYATLLKNYQEEIKETRKTVSSTLEIQLAEDKQAEEQIAASVRSNMDSEQIYYRSDKNKRTLTLTILTIDTPEYLKAAELISKMWNKIGVHAPIKKISTTQITREILRDHNYQVLLYGELSGSDPDPFSFWHSSQTEYPGINLALFSDRVADKLLEDARTTIDENKRTEYYRKFQDILAKDLPAIFLYSPLHTFVANNNIKGIGVKYINQPADLYRDSVNWYIKTKWLWK